MAKFKEYAEEAATDFGIFTAASYLLQKITNAAGNKVGEKTGAIVEKKIKDLEQQQIRRELFADFQELAHRDKKNLLAMLKRSIANCTENHTVRLLGEIPMDDLGTCTRVNGLKWLNCHLPLGDVTEEEEGEIMLELLDDNGATQLLKQAKYEGGLLARKIVDGVKTHAPEAQQKLESAGDALAPLADALTGWLRRHGGGR